MSIKVTIYGRPKQDDTMPVCIRITANRESTYISIAHAFVKPERLDKAAGKVKDSHPEFVRMNAAISGMVSKYSSHLLEFGDTARFASAARLKELILFRDRWRNRFILTPSG